MEQKPLIAAASGLPDARMLRTRAALRGALLALLEEKPFDRVTIREIATRSRTGYATFFRHYDTKTALLDDIAGDEIRVLLGLSLPVLLEHDPRASARALCLHVDERRTLWSALLTGGAAGTMREAFMRQVRQIPPDPSFPQTWLPDDLRVIYGASATMEILTWWLQKGREVSVEQVTTILDRLVITPTVAGD